MWILSASHMQVAKQCKLKANVITKQNTQMQTTLTNYTSIITNHMVDPCWGLWKIIFAITIFVHATYELNHIWIIFAITMTTGNQLAQLVEYLTTLQNKTNITQSGGILNSHKVASLKAEIHSCHLKSLLQELKNKIIQIWLAKKGSFPRKIMFVDNVTGTCLLLISNLWALSG